VQLLYSRKFKLYGRSVICHHLTGFRLNCLRSCFSSPNTNNLLDRRDENLAVADFSGARSAHDSVDLRCFFIGNQNLNFYFGQKIDNVFGAAVKLRMSFSAAEAFDLDDRHAFDA
jgi:hypothetical protein